MVNCFASDGANLTGYSHLESITPNMAEIDDHLDLPRFATPVMNESVYDELQYCQIALSPSPSPEFNTTA
jgi:hypothetical protein